MNAGSTLPKLLLPSVKSAVKAKQRLGQQLPRIALAEEMGWRRYEADTVALWFKGYLHGVKPQELVAALGSLLNKGGLTALTAWLDQLDGHFALIAEHPKAVLAAVDPVRSIPLIHGSGPEGYIIGQIGLRLVERLSLGVGDVDPGSATAAAMSGYTIGDDTLYLGVKQIGPGCFALFRSGARAPAIGRYHAYEPWKPTNEDDDAALCDRLSAVTDRIIAKLMTSAQGRPILVPLSAGLDSRLIASGLAAAGYENVKCFAYGRVGNHEAETSRIIAERLGFPWRFVPYSIGRMSDVFSSAGHTAYVQAADSLTGVYFPQEYHALRTLEGDGWVPKDAIIVNGQSGDYISGNHIPRALRVPGADVDVEARKTRIINALVEKHFALWRGLQTPEPVAQVQMRLAQEIDRLGDLPDDPANDYGVYERCEFQDRQSKYVINGQRLYEFLGYEWRLPLWDRDYLDFWQTVPLSAKTGQRLYRAMLKRDDRGGVWRNIPINRKTIRPSWINPVRAVAKTLHIPLGRRRWHDFERRYLSYWMSNLCGYAIVPWRLAAADKRGARHELSWHVEAWLAGKGLAWDGKSQAGGMHD